MGSPEGGAPVRVALCFGTQTSGCCWLGRRQRSGAWPHGLWAIWRWAGGWGGGGRGQPHPCPMPCHAASPYMPRGSSRAWTLPLPRLPIASHGIKPGPQAASPLPRPLTPVPSPHAVWFYFGVVGSFLFTLIQLVLLIDFAHCWNQRWLCKAEECDSRAWYAGERCPDVVPVGPQAGGKPQGASGAAHALGRQWNQLGLMEGRGDVCGQGQLVPG